MTDQQDVTPATRSSVAQRTLCNTAPQHAHATGNAMPTKTPLRAAAVTSLKRAVHALTASAVKAASGEFPPLNPRTAIVYFDLHMEDYNMEEDENSSDPDAQARYAEFLALGNGDLTEASRKAESMAMNEIQRKLKSAGITGELGNEGHSDDSLVMKFGVDSVDDVRKVVDFINRNSGGGDDCIYLNAPYMEAREFQFFPDGVNNDKFTVGGNGTGDINEWLEAQGAPVTSASTKSRAVKAAGPSSPEARLANAKRELKTAREECPHWGEENESDNEFGHECCYDVDDAKRKVDRLRKKVSGSAPSEPAYDEKPVTTHAESLASDHSHEAAALSKAVGTGPRRAVDHKTAAEAHDLAAYTNRRAAKQAQHPDAYLERAKQHTALAQLHKEKAGY